MKSWHDFKTAVINITRARAVAAGAHTLAQKNTSNSGIQPMDDSARVEAANRESVTIAGNLDTR